MIQHPLMDEVRRLAPTSPRGQKRILAIGEPLIYRVKRGAWRGATWVDDQAGIVWLLAAARREEGSRKDAYQYFESLHGSGRLLPTPDDRLRDRVEAAARWIGRLEREIPPLLEHALATPSRECRHQVAGNIDIRLYAARSAGIREVWLAVSTRHADGSTIHPRMRDMIFAIAERTAGPGEWEWRSDWPTGKLLWFEIARLGVIGS